METIKHEIKLENHADFSTQLNKDWKLKVEFISFDKNGDVIPVKDPFITKSDLVEIHEAITGMYKEFGFPDNGDIILPANDKSQLEIVEKIIDWKDKTIKVVVA